MTRPVLPTGGPRSGSCCAAPSAISLSLSEHTRLCTRQGHSPARSSNSPDTWAYGPSESPQVILRHTPSIRTQRFGSRRTRTETRAQGFPLAVQVMPALHLGPMFIFTDLQPHPASLMSGWSAIVTAPVAINNADPR